MHAPTDTLVNAGVCNAQSFQADIEVEAVKILLDTQTQLESSDAEVLPVDPNRVINSQNKSGNTPLHWAALNGHLQIITLLLNQGADPSILNAAGHDVLFEAELNEKQEAVEVLLAEGKGLDQGLAGKGNIEDADDIDQDSISELDDAVNRQNVQGLIDEMHKIEVEEDGGLGKS
jgi:Ankyrin repeats (3 copies)